MSKYISIIDAQDDCGDFGKKGANIVNLCPAFNCFQSDFDQSIPEYIQWRIQFTSSSFQQEAQIFTDLLSFYSVWSSVSYHVAGSVVFKQSWTP